MCGRYINISKIKAIENRFNARMKQPERYRMNTNISIGDYAPVITQEKPHEIQFLTFGFTPSWAKKPCYQFNARSEGDYNQENASSYSGTKGITQKPMFRNAIRFQRCLIPADAFIEGPHQTKLSEPYLVFLKNKQRPFAFAGIYDNWKNPLTGEIISSFAIITTTANDLFRRIGSHRSPVILDNTEEQTWLHPYTPLKEITSILHPYPDGQLNAYPISSKIKHPKANGTALLTPLGECLFSENSSSQEQSGTIYRHPENRQPTKNLQLSI